MSDRFGSQKRSLTPPLIEAIEKQNTERVRELLESGADPNLEYLHYFPLFAAAAYNNIRIVDLLLRKKANVNAIETLQGWTALHNAACGGNLSAIIGLFIYRADPFLKTIHGYTARDLAQIHSHIQAAQLLEEYMRRK